MPPLPAQPGVHNGEQRLKALVQSVAGGIDLHRVLRPAQGGRSAVGVPLIPLQHVLIDLLKVDMLPLLLKLRAAAAGTVGGIGGGCTLNEYSAHFAIWCMLSAPLLMGHDVRNTTPEIAEILLNTTESAFFATFTIESQLSVMSPERRHIDAPVERIQGVIVVLP